MSIESNDHPNRQRAALAISEIHIRRIDGIDLPYALRELSPGINLVHGPNAVGKSRTAAALQALIWPGERSSRAELTGLLLLDDDALRVEVEGLRSRYEGRGVAGSDAPFAASGRDRYLLTLHDLLMADNRKFAETIHREAAGGYDLNGVRQEMRLASKPKPRSRKASESVREARAKVLVLKAEDRALYGREQSLAAAEGRLEAARQAAERTPILQAALEYLDAADAVREAEAVRATFGEPIGSMTGEELAEVKKLDARRIELLDRRVRLEHDIAGTAEELNETGFAESLPAGHLLPELRERLASIRERESDLRQLRQAIERERARVDVTRGRIASELSDNQLRALDVDGLRTLSEMTRQYLDLLAGEQAASALYEWLGSVEQPVDLDRLRRATEILHRHLQIGDGNQIAVPSGLLKMVLIGASVVIVALAAVLAMQVTPAWIIVAISAVPVLIVAFRPMDSANNADGTRLQRQYEGLGLALPESWESGHVLALFDNVQQLRASAEVDNEKAIRWGGLASRRRDLQLRREEIEARRLEMIEAYGVAPDDATPEGLRAIAETLEGWRQASDVLATSLRAEAVAIQELETHLAAFNGLVRELGATPAGDAAAASAVLEALTARIDRARELHSRLDGQRRMLNEQVHPEIERVDRELAEMWQKHDLEHGDFVALTGLCERVPSCRTAQRKVEDARAVLSAKRAALAHAPEYFELGRSELQEELSTAQEMAERREAILRQISDVQAGLDQAKRQTRLEEAIAREEQALEQLRQTRERDLLDVAGWHVLEFIRDRNHTENRPAVFRKADDLLIRFTAGAYRLDLQDGAQPEFRAVETDTGRILELDQLSSGTRVQLLMAVRLAFIESAEQGPRLPLTLDEVLGNTDDIRANAIIDAAIEIARDGRQVIYFTAQQDEIAKWRARLDGMPERPLARIIDLAEVRGRAAAERPVPSGWTPQQASRLDIPAGTDYHAARVLLNVAPVDFWAKCCDGVDLWYLLPDVASLVTLRERGVRQWGQYRSIFQSGRYVLPIEERQHRCVLARAAVIEEFLNAWQHGRPRPISPHGLRECGLITDAFIEPVVALCRELDGDCIQLLDALRSRRVSRFRADAIEELERYFHDEGFMTELQPLSDEMIRARAFAIAGDALSDGLLHSWEVDALLHSLTGASVDSPVVAD